MGDIHTVVVKPSGWNGDITIEYGVAQAHEYDPTLSVIWRVKGTQHCFTIDEHKLNRISNGNYIQHFKKALEGFRKDYLSWFTEEEYKQCEWKYDYQKQFGKFILPEQNNNKQS